MELCIKWLIRMAIVQILIKTDFDTESIIQFVVHTYPMTKRHDRFAMENFTTTEMEWIEKYLDANLCTDLPGNTITHLHCHSDNAGQHSKNTGALEFFTHLMHLWGGAGKCSYIYSFGAPGHEKGVYDGLGGSMKTKVHNLIQGSKTGQAIQNAEWIHR
jgi:hypothetical protein